MRLISLILTLLTLTSEAQFRMGFSYQHRARKVVSVTLPAPAKIAVTEDQVLNLTHNEGNLAHMVDGNIATAVQPTYNSCSDTAIVIIDLLAVHTLQKLRLYHTLGSQRITLTGRQTLANSDVGSVIFDGNISNFNSWVEYPTTIQARFITFTMWTPNASYPEEFEFYGSPHTGPENIAPATITSNTINADFIGSNAYNWTITQAPNAVKWYRNYTEMQWVAQSSQNYTDSLIFVHAAGEFGDDRMQLIKDEGMTQILCVQNCPSGLKNATATTNNLTYRAHPYNADPLNPLSYTDYAKIGTQYVYRYGSVPTLDANLKLYTWTRSGGYFVQSRLSGLNTVKYFEFGNERNKWWQGIRARYDPFQYAAECSALWDGHEGAIPNTGVKVADPNAKMVMAGMANHDWRYIRLMQLWFRYNRTDQKFCLDYINFHTYANDGLAQFNGTRGKSPEWFKFGEFCKHFVSYCKAYAPDCGVMMTEFGYDDNSGIQAPNDYPNSEKSNVQAGWGVRTFLNFAKSGLTNAVWFNIADNNGQTVTSSGASALYAKSGLILSQALGYGLKPSGICLNNLSTILSNKTWTVAEDTAAHRYTLTNGTETYDFYWNRSVTVSPEVGKTKTSITLQNQPFAETSITSTQNYNLTSEIPFVIHTTTP